MADVVPATQTPGEIFAAKKAAIDNEASLTDTDESLKEFQEAKLAAILTADSFDALNQVAQATGLTSARDLVGRTLTILDAAIRESAPEFRANSRLQKWAVVKAVETSTGEEFIIDGGGDQFVSGILRMRDLYDFPFTGTLLAFPTGNGQMHYWRWQDPGRKASKA